MNNTSTFCHVLA